jgi:cytoskeleton protein RodZ
MPDQDSSGHIDFGAQLRHERELRNVSLDDVARVTRISRRYLEALEEGRPQDLPGLPFVKGFVGAYARHLGLDPAETLERFESATAARPVEPAPAPPPKKKGGGNRVVRIVTPVLLAAAGLALFLFLAGRAPEESQTPAPPPVAEPAPVPEAAPEEVAAAPSPAVSPAPSPESSARGLSLVLTAAAACWIHAVPDEGPPRDFTIQPGQTAELTAARTLAVTFGNAGGVSLRLNGRDLGPAGRSGEVKRDLVFSWDPVGGAQFRESPPNAPSAPGGSPSGEGR